MVTSHFKILASCVHLFLSKLKLNSSILYLQTLRSIISLQPKLVERSEGTSVWSSLREKRALLNMKLLGLAPSTPHKNIQEGRPTYREQFVPPQCNILTYLLTKVSRRGSVFA